MSQSYLVNALKTSDGHVVLGVNGPVTDEDMVTLGLFAPAFAALIGKAQFEAFYHPAESQISFKVAEVCRPRTLYSHDGP